MQGSSNPTTDIKKVNGTTIDTGAGASSAGTPRVILASDQATLPVSLSSSPLPTGAATEATLASRLSESDFDTKVGSLTEAAPGTDTASSGLNGRLQRIAQRLTALIALIPTALGQGTMATSFKVVLPSDQSPIPITDDSGSLTVDNNGTFAVQDSEKVVDNAGFTDGTTKVLPAGYILDETAGTALTENDAGAARMDSKRAQVMVIEDGTTRGSTQRVAVKAASTAATTSDPALVVSPSPNSVGREAVSHETGSIYNGTTALTPKYSTPLNALAATADQVVVAAVTSKKIRVLSFLAVVGATNACAIFFESGTSTAITPTFNFAANGGMSSGFSPVGHFETAAGQALTVTTAGASATIGIQVTYVEV